MDADVMSKWHLRVSQWAGMDHVRQTDGRTNGQTNGQTDRQTDKRRQAIWKGRSGGDYHAGHAIQGCLQILLMPSQVDEPQHLPC